MREVGDQEQMDILKKWWKDYGRVILLMVVLGLAIGFGWRYWQHRKAAHLEVASVMYQEMLVSQRMPGQKWQDTVKTLQTDFSKTPYAGMAVLFAARYAATQRDYKSSIADLQWVVEHGTMPAQRDLAMVRLARVYAGTKQPDKAIELLKGTQLTVYQPMADRVLAGIYQRQGKSALAQHYYAKAAVALQEVGMQDELLDMQKQTLPGVQS